MAGEVKVGTIRAVKSSGGMVGLLLEDDSEFKRLEWRFGNWQLMLNALQELFGNSISPNDIIGGRVGYTVNSYGGLETLQDADTVVEGVEA